MDAAVVTLAALATAAATGLGALPLLLRRRADERARGLGTAAASGFMLGASAGLLVEGAGEGGAETVVGGAIGLGFMYVTSRFFGHREHVHFGPLRGRDAVGALTLVAVMTIHSVTEGVGVGVAFGDGASLGGLITLAIAIHNIPEGLAISLVLVPRGISVRQAAWWSVFSSLPQPVMALPAFLVVEWFAAVLPFGLGFAGGAMIWMVARQLLPDASRAAGWPRVATVGGVSAAAMVALQAALL